MKSMITVKEADQLISKNIQESPSICVALQDAFGMILREDLCADRDLPPFDRVMMDGIGMHFDTWKEGNRTFSIEGVQRAGIPALDLKDTKACLEVMTGAVLPGGCDCVIPVEDIDVKDGKATLREGLDLIRMQNIHRQASDHECGACLVPKGYRLLAPQVSVAASVGKSEVLVCATPKVAVIGTGDELVGLDQKCESYQFRQSNSYAVQSALNAHGYKHVERFHIQDDKSVLEEKLRKMIEDFDVLVLSGGVSMGKFDYVPEVLAAIGVEVIFHKVRQRPGKPFWFGRNKEGKPVFALPGNPVSTQIGTYRYVLPYLSRAVGARAISEELAVLDADVEIKTDLTFFLPVKIKSGHDGRLRALPIFPNGSGDYASLAVSDGFIELPANTYQFPKGTVTRLYRWSF